MNATQTIVNAAFLGIHGTLAGVNASQAGVNVCWLRVHGCWTDMLAVAWSCGDTCLIGARCIRHVSVARHQRPRVRRTPLALLCGPGLRLRPCNRGGARAAHFVFALSCDVDPGGTGGREPERHWHAHGDGFQGGVGECALQRSPSTVFCMRAATSSRCCSGVASGSRR